jgi:plasmid maintenance system antidote protein VapI
VLAEHAGMRSDVPTPADLRAEIARRDIPVYILAARLPMHPVRLGRLLRGRLTLTPEMAVRILRALEEETRVAS